MPLWCDDPKVEFCVGLPLFVFLQLVSSGGLELLGGGLQSVYGFLLERANALGRAGGSLCSEVGRIVGQYMIDLVPDGGDDGPGALSDCAGKGFFIEGPEVFDAAAASGEDNEVEGGAEGCRSLQHGFDFFGGAFTLYPGGENDDTTFEFAAGKDAEEVAEGSPGW